MLTRVIQSVLAAGVILLSSPSLAQDWKVGTILDDKEHPLYAWANKMPPTPDSLHVRGWIVAPTPCYGTVTTYEGDSKSDPPIYRIKISLVEPRDVICIQLISPVPFRYDQPNYTGTHQEAEVFSESNSKIKKIEVVQ